jgi:5-methylcytosine-specific restriction enzyme A
MPQRAFRVCQHPQCGALCRGRYCDEHVIEHANERAKVFDEARGSAAARGYDRRWRRLSKAIIARDPLCKIAKICTADYPGQLPAPSECADHIISRARGGRDTMSNLQGACIRCNSWKARTQDSALADRDARRAEQRSTMQRDATSGDAIGRGGSNL